MEKMQFAQVRFDEFGQGYTYLTDDLPLSVGDTVWVPVGDNARLTKATVCALLSEYPLDAPYPIDKVKKIHAIVESSNDGQDRIPPVTEHLSPALYPPLKEDELKILLSNFVVETEYADPNFCDGEMNLTIQNPYGGTDLTIYLEDSFAIGFAGWSGWFEPHEDGYLQFLSTLIGLLSGQLGVLLVGEEEPYCLLWKGDLPKSEAELTAYEVEIPIEGILLMLTYFDPGKNRSDYLLKEEI